MNTGIAVGFVVLGLLVVVPVFKWFIIIIIRVLK